MKEETVELCGASLFYADGSATGTRCRLPAYHPGGAEAHVLPMYRCSACAKTLATTPVGTACSCSKCGAEYDVDHALVRKGRR